MENLRDLLFSEKDGIATWTLNRAKSMKEKVNSPENRSPAKAGSRLRFALPVHEKCNKLHFSLPGSAHLAAVRRD